MITITNSHTIQSNHFQLETVGDGIYVAFAKDGGHAVCNAGIVNLGNRVLIFDSFFASHAAQELKAAAIALTNQPIRFVVNSHHHADHVGGNALLAQEADIVSSVRTKQAMSNESVKEYEDYQANAATRLQELESARKSEKNNAKQRQLAAQIRYYQAVVAALPEFSLKAATLSFETKLVIEGTKRTVELLNYGGGHSVSDTVMYVPDAKLLFTGDLLSIGYHPYLADGDPGELDRILNQITTLAPEMLVPGHGPIALLDDIRAQRQYISQLTEIAMRELVYGTLDAKEAATKAAHLPIPPVFASWENTSYYSENLIFLYKRLLAAYAD